MTEPQMEGVKYAVMPGEVRSRSDGDIHWISAGRLMQLYNVPPSQCVVIRHPSERILDGLIPLRPRYDGDYSLPEEPDHD